MATFTFRKSDGLSFADPGVVSQTVHVVGLTGNVTGVQVYLQGVSHTWPDDLDMLLVADASHNLEFWSDAGTSTDIVNQSFTIGDGFGSLLPDATALAGGSYRPTDYTDEIETMASFGLTGTLVSAAPAGTGTFASAFAGAGNGDWGLYVRDDSGGDFGGLTSWSVIITTDSNLAAVSGTAGDDTMFLYMEGTDGLFFLNGDEEVDFAGVASFSFDGGEGNDSYIGVGGVDSVRGGTGVDNISLGGGADFLQLMTGDDASGETYNGGSGTDSLEFSSGGTTNPISTFDLRNDSVTSFETFAMLTDFASGDTVAVKLTAAQLGTANLYGNFGGGVTDIYEITMGNAGSLNLGGRTIVDMGDAGDKFVVVGDNTLGDNITGRDGVDSISGNGGADNLNGNGGADTLRGGAGNDTLYVYHSQLASGMVLDGGADSDELTIGSPNGAYDVNFEGVVLSGIETLTLNNAVYGALTVEMTASQIDSGFTSIGKYRPLDPIVFTVTLDSKLVDLHSIGLVNWSASDRFNILGDSDNETISGSSGVDSILADAGNDSIKGYGGNDTIDGGTGADTADYSDKLFAVETVLDANNDTANTVYVATSAVSGVFTEDSVVRIENLIGGAGKDKFSSSVASGVAANNFFSGNGGDDSLVGGAGNDTLRGGTGKDTLSGGANTDTADYSDKAAKVTVLLNASGNATVGAGADIDTLTGIENVIGGTAGDALTGNQIANSLSGGAGNDTLKGMVGNDTLNGGANADTADFSEKTTKVTVGLNDAGNGTAAVAAGPGIVAETDTLQGIEGVRGGSAGDSMTGGAGSNVFEGNAGDDTLNGGSGDDTLNGGAGKDKLNGGNGFDMASYKDATTSVHVTLVNGAATVNISATNIDTLTGIEGLFGGKAGDVLTGDSGNNYIDGVEGADSISGGNGSDILYGRGGVDTIRGGSGADQLDMGEGELAAGEIYDGGADLDTLVLFTDDASASFDLRNVALVSIEDLAFATALSTAAVSVSLKSSQFGSLHDIYNGGASVGKSLTFNITMDGSSLDVGSRFIYNMPTNVKFGVTGGSGAETISGSNFVDVIKGGGGKDVLDGRAGIDTADYSDKAQKVTVTLSGGVDAKVFINGTAAANVEDTIRNFENVTGGTAGDKLTGDGLDNVLAGNGGNDTLSGGNGNDTLIGGAGQDNMTGGSGADVFRFAATSESSPLPTSDVIVGFVAGVDRIDLKSIDANTTTGADDAFVLDAIGVLGTAVAKGHIGWFQSGGNTYLKIANDADAAVDMVIQLNGNITLHQGDFIA